MAVAWYAGTFVGFHAVMVPVMTAWHALLDRAQRCLHGFAEEEALRVDMSAYRSRLQRSFPLKTEPATEPPAQDEC
jgi:hypothetical protein